MVFNIVNRFKCIHKIYVCYSFYNTARGLEKRFCLLLSELNLTRLLQ